MKFDFDICSDQTPRMKESADNAIPDKEISIRQDKFMSSEKKDPRPGDQPQKNTENSTQS